MYIINKNNYVLLSFTRFFKIHQNIICFKNDPDCSISKTRIKKELKLLIFKHTVYTNSELLELEVSKLESLQILIYITNFSFSKYKKLYSNPDFYLKNYFS